MNAKTVDINVGCLFYVREAQKICRIEKSGATEGIISAKIKNHADMRIQRDFGKNGCPTF